MQLSQESVIRISVDQLDFYIFVVLILLCQFLSREYAAVAAAQNDYFFQEKLTSFI
ncbi:hypothetical protein D3C73_734880 [compost metagenome]